MSRSKKLPAYASLDEAEAAAGFDLAIPDAVDGCSEKQFRALDADGDKMIEVIYASGEDEIARIRKAPGAEDISGDCNAYAEQTELTSGDAAVTMKGADGLKTGHTEEAGFCLAASATKGERRLIEVMSGMSSNRERSEEAERLMSWGFPTMCRGRIRTDTRTPASACAWIRCRGI